MLRQAITLTTLLAIASTALARPDPELSSQRGASATGAFVLTQAADERPPGPADLSEAIEIALAHYGGEVSRAETVERDGRTVHEVRLLVEGTVRSVLIDPATGAIIPQERSQD